MKNKISSSVVSEANLDTKIDFLGATITKFFGVVKVHEALEEGRVEEVAKKQEYVSKGLTEGFIKIERLRWLGHVARMDSSNPVVKSSNLSQVVVVADKDGLPSVGPNRLMRM